MIKKSLMLAVAVVAMAGVSVRAHCGKCGVGDEKATAEHCDVKKASMVDDRLQHLTKELGLSTDQQAKVKAVLEKKIAAKCALHEETDKKADALQETAEQEIRAALTPEQAAKLDEMKKKGHGCCAGKADKCPKCAVGEKAACCPKAGEKGHSCPIKKGKAAHCPMSGGKSKK